MKIISLMMLLVMLFVMLISNASAEIYYYYLSSDFVVYTEEGQAYLLHAPARITYTFLLKSIDGNITSVSGVNTYKTIFVVCSISDDLAFITFTFRKTGKKHYNIGHKSDEVYKIAKAVIKAYDDTR